MRAFLRKMTGVLAMVFFVGVVFSATLLSVLNQGMTRAALLLPMALYLLAGLSLTARKRWGLSLFCLAGLVLHLTVIQESAKTLAMKRESRTKEALEQLRSAVGSFHSETGRFPSALSELPAVRLSPLICLKGRASRLEIPPEERANSGAWVYDFTTGTVSVDCEMTESTSRRWSAR